MSAKLRLLYSSNIMGCASGYGVQSGSLLPRLAELPEFDGAPGSLAGRKNIAQFAWYGLHGLKLNLEGFEIYPAFDDAFGNDVIGAHTKHFGANVTVTLIDAFVLQNVAESVKPSLFCPWLPIDHDPIPDAVLRGIAGAYMPLTYAKWGHELLTAAGVENVYIPHGIEPSIYKVLADRGPVRQFKRDLTGLDNAFLCVMVAANKGFPDRKWFQGQLEVFRDFRKDVPHAKLYLHSLPTGHHGGIPFAEFAQRLGLTVKIAGDPRPADVIFPNPYFYRLGFPPEYLSMVYNAADVLLATATSEGFGIPIVEAQACGAPVITTNFSAMPELVRWGHLVEVADKQLTGMMSYTAWPSKTSMLDKLRRLYEAWEIAGGDWPLTRRLQTSKAIHEEYSWDTIVREQWAPFMARVAADAPPLDSRFQVAVPAMPPAQPNDVGRFVDALNEGLAQEQPRKVRRVAPLTNGHAQPLVASNEEAQVPA